MRQLRDVLIDAYMDYVNNYLTIEKWGEHNGLSVEHAKQLYWLAREVFESQHPEA